MKTYEHNKPEWMKNPKRIVWDILEIAFLNRFQSSEYPMSFTYSTEVGTLRYVKLSKIDYDYLIEIYTKLDNSNYNSQLKDLEFSFFIPDDVYDRQLEEFNKKYLIHPVQ